MMITSGPGSTYGFPAHGGPGGVQIVEDVDAARVLDELGGEVVAAGVGGGVYYVHMKQEKAAEEERKEKGVAGVHLLVLY